MFISEKDLVPYFIVVCRNYDSYIHVSEELAMVLAYMFSVPMPPRPYAFSTKDVSAILSRLNAASSDKSAGPVSNTSACISSLTDGLIQRGTMMGILSSVMCPYRTYTSIVVSDGDWYTAVQCVLKKDIMAPFGLQIPSVMET